MTVSLPDRNNRASVDDAARDWIVRLASGEPTDADMARFRAWLAERPEHRSAFERARELWQCVESVEDVFAPSAVPRPWHGRTGARAAAAGLAIAASLALVVAHDDIRVAALADYVTAAGAQRTITLDDGSTVQLNTGSAIAVRFSARERRIELMRGEAFFQVAHDPARPLRVISQDGATRAVGTAFVVRDGQSAANDGRVVVSVTEGIVKVTSPDTAETAATITVRAGERALYHAGARPRVIGPIGGAGAAPWREGRIVMDGVPFAEAIAELNRYRPGRILLLGDATRYRPVSGVFSIEKLDEALAGLAATHGLSVTRLTDRLVMLR